VKLETQQAQEPFFEVLDISRQVDALTLALKLPKHDAAVLCGDVVSGLSDVDRLKLALRPEAEQVFG